MIENSMTTHMQDIATKTADDNLKPTEESQAPEKSPRHSVSQTVREYTSSKVSKEPKLIETEMQERVVSVALSGSKEVKKEIQQLFPDQKISEITQQLEKAREYTAVLIEEQTKILEGQKEKIERMTEFVTQMKAWSETLMIEFTTQEQQRSDISAEEIVKNITEYQKNIQNMVIEATRTITYQDIRASAITLGDHGWMHLTQDLRDSVEIASQKRGALLAAKEQFMLGLASAFHDIGYAVPEVSKEQRSGKGKYGTFDKGHPINSYVYMVAQKSKYENILGQEDTDALFQIVANHENPEKAEAAGKYKDLAEAFALADASAAFGKDKLPPIVVQIPEILSYLNAISLLNSEESFNLLYSQIDQNISVDEAKTLFQSEVVQQLRDSVVAKIDEKIKHTPPSSDSNDNNQLYQAEAFKNAIDHFGPVSLKFLLGRMSAESTAVQVSEDKKVEFTINAGFARQMEAKGIINKTVEASAILTVKLFLEQAAITIPDKNIEKAIVDCVAKNEMPPVEIVDALSNLGITILVTQKNNEDTTTERSVQLMSEQIVVVSKTDADISADNTEFYDKISQNLDYANEAAGKFIQNHKKKEEVS